MPIYEYACQACGHKFDTIQNFSDEPLTDCPVCQEPTLKKLISASAFHLKGSGWYVTDFKNPPTKSESTEKNKNDTKETTRGSNEPQKAIDKNKNTQAPKTTDAGAGSVDKITTTDKSDKKSS